MATDWNRVLDVNIKELEQLIHQYNKCNSKEALGKIYYCLIAIQKILKKQ